MAEDGREGRSTVSNSVSIAGGSSGPIPAVEIRDEETVSISFIKLEYSSDGSVESKLTLYNEPEDVEEQDLSDDVDHFLLGSGDTLVMEDPTYEDITDGVVAQLDGNSDGEIIVTIGGVKVTG